MMYGYARRTSITFSPESSPVVIAHRPERSWHTDDGQQTVKRDRAEKMYAKHRCSRGQQQIRTDATTVM